MGKCNPRSSNGKAQLAVQGINRVIFQVSHHITLNPHIARQGGQKGGRALQLKLRPSKVLCQKADIAAIVSQIALCFDSAVDTEIEVKLIPPKYMFAFDFHFCLEISAESYFP